MSVEACKMARFSIKPYELRIINAIEFRGKNTYIKNGKLKISKSKSSRLSYILVETLSVEMVNYDKD